MKTNILALPEIASPWQYLPFAPVPKDRGIWVKANVISEDEYSTWVDQYEGYAQWDEASKDWKDRRGMSIKMHVEAEFHVLIWMEVEARAEHCPDAETDTMGSIYYWDDEWRRENGTSGFYALLGIRHTPTWVDLKSESQGPFATRSEACEALVKMLGGSR